MGLIIGGAIGGVFVLILIAIIARFVYTRKRVLTQSTYSNSGDATTQAGEMGEIGLGSTFSGAFQEFDTVFTIEGSVRPWGDSDDSEME
jgi:hypothetical protein